MSFGVLTSSDSNSVIDSLTFRHGLLQQYQQAVLAVFINPPEHDKQAHHDQIKEFRQLTHSFEKAVIGLQSPPEPE